MKDIILCDLDGTLANIEHRLHYINPAPGQRKDWDAFHKVCIYDTPYEDVIRVVDQLRVGSCGCGYGRLELHIVSGRNDTVRKETEAWLDRYVSDCVDWRDHLHMRKQGDYRPDREIKLEMVRELGFTPDRVLCIFDDRQSVVDMWRANGYRCLQVQVWEE